MITTGRQTDIKLKLTLKLDQIQTKNLKQNPKTFQKILVWSCCVMSFFRQCPANAAFLVLQTLTRSKDLSENLSLKLLCDVNFPTLSSQCDISSFKMVNFQLDDYPW